MERLQYSRKSISRRFTSCLACHYAQPRHWSKGVQIWHGSSILPGSDHAGKVSPPRGSFGSPAPHPPLNPKSRNSHFGVKEASNKKVTKETSKSTFINGGSDEVRSDLRGRSRSHLRLRFLGLDRMTHMSLFSFHENPSNTGYNGKLFVNERPPCLCRVLLL